MKIQTMLVIATVGFSSIACTEKPSPAGNPSSICNNLTKDWVWSEKTLAQLSIDGVGDNSAPRETNRQLRILNRTLQKQMTLQLMLANHCSSLPDQADISGDYMVNALECETALLRRSNDDLPGECDKSKWQKSSDAKTDDKP